MLNLDQADPARALRNWRLTRPALPRRDLWHCDHILELWMAEAFLTETPVSGDWRYQNIWNALTTDTDLVRVKPRQFSWSLTSSQSPANLLINILNDQPNLIAVDEEVNRLVGFTEKGCRFLILLTNEVEKQGSFG